MNKNSKIYIAGHTGVVGSTLIRYLKEKGYSNIITYSHKELDLTDSYATKCFFEKERPEYVFFTAALSCSVAIDHLCADIFYQNTMMQTNIIHNALLYNVKKMLYFSSACMYPAKTAVPIKEEYLLESPPTQLCQSYALVKLLGTKMCEAYNLQYGTNFISIVLSNIYGNAGEFDLDKARVQYALLHKIHLAKLYSEENYPLLQKDLKIQDVQEIDEYLRKHGIMKNSVLLWGDGTSCREFLHSYDVADACYFIMQNINFKDMYDENVSSPINTHINIGSGNAVSIRELSEIIADIVGYKGEILFDSAKPDNKTNRTLDCTKLFSYGWKPSISLVEGTRELYNWYKSLN